MWRYIGPFPFTTWRATELVDYEVKEHRAKELAGRIKVGTGRLVVNEAKKLDKFPLEKIGFLREEFPEMFK